MKSDHNYNFWYFQNNHIKTTKIFSVRSGPDPPIFKKIAFRSSPDPATIGFSPDPAPSGPDPCSSLLRSRGVRSLKFFTLTPLLLRLNILRLHSDSETFSSFGLRLLFKLQSVCCKLLAASKRPYPVFTLKRLKKRIKRNCWALQNMWPMGRLRLWILTFENLFIRHLYCNSTAWRECSGLGINEVNVKEKP